MELSLAAVLFYSLAALAAGTAVAAVVAEDPSRAAAWLLGTLAAVSGVSFLLGAYPAGAAQLLAAVGGSAALRRAGARPAASEVAARLRAGAGWWAVATAAGLLLFGTFAVTLAGGDATPADRASAGDDSGISFDAYLLPIGLVAVHLLVALAAAAYLARGPRPPQDAAAPQPAGAPAP
jgi:NADH:ubiquinone oxidoreductase subunit 6 (subunit J)